MSTYKEGLCVKSILKVTLPHSFEFIGFWLSGAIGFYIAWNIILFVCFWWHDGGWTTGNYKIKGKSA
jgi:uncharacterized membrane protein SpoIIM required for sporulation